MACGAGWGSGRWCPTDKDQHVKLRRIEIENIRSFLDSQEVDLSGPISVIVGPNGGGKTNLLDTIVVALRRNLLASWAPTRTYAPGFPDQYHFERNASLPTLERHTLAPSRDSRIKVDIEITAPDIENMKLIHENAIGDNPPLGVARVPQGLFEVARSWTLDEMKPGSVFTFDITNDTVAGYSGLQQQVAQYLSLYEADVFLRNATGMPPLSIPMVSMPATRSIANFQATLSLASHNDTATKQQLDAATSRSSQASLVSLSVGRLAAQYRQLLEKDTGNARAEFYSQPHIVRLSEILKSLGYEWELECTDVLTNTYSVLLKKQGTSFLIHAASSGEKELLTYLFAVIGLALRDAVIIIDEPELHLHPRWQKSLLSLFEILAAETGNQFIMATHAPLFISPDSIQYVSRVYTDNQQSRVVRLNRSGLPNAKHLFSIVNSHNNERMFFADKVVLVEGISDRLVFQKIFLEAEVLSPGETVEFIEVGGKGFFRSYSQILEACEVRYALIADLDYVNEIGTPEIKSLFSIEHSKIDSDVLTNSVSKDGEALSMQLEHTIATGEIDALRDLWRYIQARFRRVRQPLQPAAQDELKSFLETQRKERRFLLSRGDLEAYLPEGYRSKDVDKLIDFVSGEVLSRLDTSARLELTSIAAEIARI
jgi:putative ATP-dependent endonuclease of OLD family